MVPEATRKSVALRARLVVDLVGLSDEGANRRLRDASMDARPGCEVVLRVPPGTHLPVSGINDLRAHGRHASVVVEAPDTATGDAWLRMFAGDPWEVI